MFKIRDSKDFRIMKTKSEHKLLSLSKKTEKKKDTSTRHLRQNIIDDEFS